VQGLTLLGGDIVAKNRPELLNTVLNSFIKRLSKNIKDDEQHLGLKDVMAFMELFIQFMRGHPQMVDQVDTQRLLSYTLEHFLLL
jgi:hypothetical protein